MTNHIKLDAQRHAAFLAEQRKDPVTKEPLRAGTEIVICANCKYAFLAENWPGQCPFCHGTSTLSDIPISSLPSQLGRRHPRPPTTIVETHSPHSRGWLKWAIIGGVLGLIALCVMIFNPPSTPPAQPTAPPPVYNTSTQQVYLPPTNNNIPPITSISIPAPTLVRPTETRNMCGGAPPIRVEKGDTAQVTSNCGDHILMRENPVVATNAKQYLYSGDELRIIDGPQCSNHVSFFLVEAPKYNKTGWVAEAEPDSNNYCIQLRQ